MSLNSRIRNFINFKGLSVQSFENHVGLSNGAVSKMGDNTRKSTIAKICEVFPELNQSWLLTGEGEMLTQNYESNVSAYAVAKKAIKEDTVPVRFYEVNPTAHFDFNAFLSEDAEMFNIIPVRGEKIDDSCCLFKIHGDSMSPQIQSGAIVLCQEIKPTQWHSLRDCVAVVAWSHDMEDCVSLKRITKNHLLDTPSYIVLSSDNPEYPDKVRVGRGEIHCIFAAKRIISQQIS